MKRNRINTLKLNAKLDMRLPDPLKSQSLSNPTACRAWMMMRQRRGEIKYMTRLKRGMFGNFLLAGGFMDEPSSQSVAFAVTSKGETYHDQINRSYRCSRTDGAFICFDREREVLAV
jgi:hypothetical protein